MGLWAPVIAHGGAITGDEITVIVAGAALLFGALVAAHRRGVSPTRDESDGPEQ